MALRDFSPLTPICALTVALAGTVAGAQVKPVEPLKPSPLHPELQLKRKPDLVIRKLALKSYGPCRPGQAVLKFTVVIANTGNAPAPGIGGAGIVKVAEKRGAGPWAGGAGLGRPIPPGDTATLTVPVYYLQSAPGHMVGGAPHRFRARVDPLNHIAESNENNNLSKTVRVNAPPDCPKTARPRISRDSEVLRRNLKRPPLPGPAGKLAVTRPDLAVSQVSAAQACEINRVGLRLINLGNAGVPESAYDPRRGAVIRIDLDGRQWGTLRLADADPDKRLLRPRLRTRGHYVTLPTRRLEVGVHQVRVTVDSNNAVAELNERNNTGAERVYCRIEADDGLSPGG